MFKIKTLFYVVLLWFMVICLTIFVFVRQPLSSIDPFYNFVTPKIESLFYSNDELQILVQSSILDKRMMEEREFQKKSLLYHLDLHSLKKLDPSLPREKLENLDDISEVIKAIDEAIIITSKKYGVDPLLIKAIVIVESNYNHVAVSRKRAMGLMQIIPKTGQVLGVEDYFCPVESIEGGVKYIKYLINRYNGNLKLVLAAYNAGPTKVDSAGKKVPKIKETQNYVKRVMKIYEDLMRG